MSQSLIPTTPAEVQTIAQSLCQSGYFKDAADATKAFVKVLAGAELGLPAFQSMSGIHIVQGKPSLSSGLMAALIKRSGRYNYRVVEHTAEICRIEFYENGTLIGQSEQTMKEAKEAKLHQEWDRDSKSYKDKVTWKNFPKNMLFNRALSNGAKWHCPDIFGGPVYVEGEIDEVPVVQDTTHVVVQERTSAQKQVDAISQSTDQAIEAKPVSPAKMTKKESAEAMKLEQRKQEYKKNFSICQDDKSFNDNEGYISNDEVLTNDDKIELIFDSISYRIHTVTEVENAEAVKQRIAGWKNLLGTAHTTELLKDLIEQGAANGIKYENKKFYRPEPTNEELSEALAENG